MEKQRTPPLTVPPTRQAFVLCTRAFPEFRVRVSVWCPVPHPTRRPTPPAPAVGLQIDRQSLSRRSARDNKHGVRLIDIGGFRSRTGSTKHAYADQEGGRSTQTPHHKKCPFSLRGSSAPLPFYDSNLALTSKSTKSCLQPHSISEQPPKSKRPALCTSRVGLCGMKLTARAHHVPGNGPTRAAS